MINNSKVLGEKIIVQSRILDNFSNLSQEEKSQSALPMANNSSFNFGVVKGGEVVTRTFEVKNLGQRDLVIYKAEFNEKGATTKFNSPVKPGQTCKVEVLINTKGFEGDKTFQITLITNSPTRPVVNLLVAGNITK